MLEQERDERTERIDLRVPEYVKGRIRSAAALSGRSMSDFIIAAALEQADAVSESVERWTLDEQQSRFVLDLLMAPAQDNRALRELLKLSEPDRDEKVASASTTGSTLKASSVGASHYDA